jgi:hypothetical protein
MSAAFITLAAEPRWVNWRNEQRGERLTKVPYQPNNQRAKADDPTTWTTRDAVADAVPNIVNGLGGGVGIVLGHIGADLHLCGLDLDTCLRDSTIALWAAAILDVAQTYAEISPSGGGLKAFFYVASENIRPFLDRIGVDQKASGAAVTSLARTRATMGRPSRSTPRGVFSPSQTANGLARPIGFGCSMMPTLNTSRG